MKMNKIGIVLIFALLALLSGCKAFYEGEYEVVADHAESGNETEEDGSVREVASFAGLTNALKAYIDSGTEYGVIKAVNYSGSLEDDFSKACRDLTRDYPMGVYAVDYISHKTTPILSYTEIEVFITYKLSREEINDVINVKSTYDYYNYLNDALDNCRTMLTVQIANLSVNAESIKNYIRTYYYENPDLIVERPSVSVMFYPSPPEDYVEKIITVQLSYSQSAEELLRRKEELGKKAETLFADIGKNESEAETALRCVQRLGEAAKYSRMGATAYSALVEGAANSEGYAMALKLLCKRYGLNCVVVEGKRNGEQYYWNIVELGGEHYHIDACACDRYGMESGFLKRDSEMWGTYWWDIEQYEECSGMLTYAKVIGQPEPEQKGEGEAGAAGEAK